MFNGFWSCVNLLIVAYRFAHLYILGVPVLWSIGKTDVCAPHSDGTVMFINVLTIQFSLGWNFRAQEVF